MVTLAELLKSNADDLNAELKRAFRPLTPHIEIEGNELDALTILVNLTDKTADQKNLLDRSKCKQKLRDEKWWHFCLNTIKFIQSHNLKFPDIRSEGVIRAAAIGELPEFLFSSSKLPSHNWAYSHNSKDVNKSAFLTSEFSWKGDVSCLAIFLQDEDHPLWKKLFKLGCYKKTYKAVVKRIRMFEQYKIDVPLLGNYLTQISFPDSNGSYVSLSPVASQSIQSHCYQSLDNEYRLTAITRYSRSTNMGVTATTCGGAFKMLKALPDFSITPHHRINSNESWLTPQHIQSLEQYQNLNQLLMPDNKREVFRKQIKNDIQDMLKSWLLAQDVSKSTDALIQHLNYDLSRIKSTKGFAYEPTITRLLYGLLKYELNIPSVENTVDETISGNGLFLVLPNIRVCGATALSSPVTVGIPSLMAFFGFTHAFERNLRDLMSSLAFDSFAICIHHLHVEKRGLTKEFVQKANDTISPPATYDDWQCDCAFSLILKLNHSIHLNQNTIIRALPKRFARGSAKIAIADFEFIQSFKTITSAIQSLPLQTGKWLSLHTEPIYSLCDILTAIKSNRRLTPSCLGYHFLEKPTEKPGSLREHKHAFAECCIGLIEPIVFKKNTETDSIFWHQINHPNYVSVQTRSISDGTTD
ncbi:type I-F CRISPR-associated protein Csy2 [Vibrio parahaemolyticus]